MQFCRRFGALSVPEAALSNAGISSAGAVVCTGELIKDNTSIFWFGFSAGVVWDREW